jgi:hypothetical protein
MYDTNSWRNSLTTDVDSCRPNPRVKYVNKQSPLAGTSVMLYAAKAPVPKSETQKHTTVTTDQLAGNCNQQQLIKVQWSEHSQR